MRAMRCNSVLEYRYSAARRAQTKRIKNEQKTKLLASSKLMTRSRNAGPVMPGRPERLFARFVYGDRRKGDAQHPDEIGLAARPRSFEYFFEVRADGFLRRR
jgi:hypothetical protein